MAFHIGTHKIIERRQRVANALYGEKRELDVTYDPTHPNKEVPLWIKNTCELTGAPGLTLPGEFSGKPRPSIEMAHLNHAQYAFLPVSGNIEQGVRVEDISNTIYQHPDIGFATTPFVHYLYHQLADTLKISHHIGLTADQNNFVVEKFFIENRGVMKFLGEISIEQAFRIMLLMMSVCEDYTGSEEDDPYSPHKKLVMSYGAKHRNWFDRLDSVEAVSGFIPYAFKIATVSYLFPCNLFSWDGSYLDQRSGKYIGFDRVIDTANGWDGAEGLAYFRNFVHRSLGQNADTQMAHAISPAVIALATQSSLMDDLIAEFPYTLPENKIDEKWFRRIQRIRGEDLAAQGNIFHGLPNPSIIWALRQVWRDYTEKVADSNNILLQWMSDRDIALRQTYQSFVGQY